MYWKMQESGLTKSFLSYASLLSGASILHFSHLSSSVLTIRRGCSLMDAPVLFFLSALGAQEFTYERPESLIMWNPCLLIWQEILHFSPLLLTATSSTLACWLIWTSVSNLGPFFQGHPSGTYPQLQSSSSPWPEGLYGWVCFLSASPLGKSTAFFSKILSLDPLLNEPNKW